MAGRSLESGLPRPQSSQLGQLLGVRHKDADLGDGVGAVAAGQQPGPVSVSVARWSPTHRSNSTTYGIS